MKTLLQVTCLLWMVIACQYKAKAQAGIEPTINSTLDIIETIKVDTEQVFDLFITAGDRAGEPVRVRMRLSEPAKRGIVVLAYNYDTAAPNFKEATFNEDGIAILGKPDENMDLEDRRVYVRIRIAEVGTYRYVFDLLRGDNNVIASVSEEVVVASSVPAGIRSSLSQNPNLVKGAETDFYIQLKRGEIASGTPVYIRITLDDKAQASRLTMQFQDGPEYKPMAFNSEGVAVYGPEGGFSLEDRDVLFKASFADAATYGYKLELLNVTDKAVLATRNEVAAVNNVAGLRDRLGDDLVRVYPTLASEGYIVLEMGRVHQAQVQVLDALGRTVMTLGNMSGTNRIDTSGFAKGYYFIKVIKGAEVAGGRFLVQ